MRQQGFFKRIPDADIIAAFNMAQSASDMIRILGNRDIGGVRKQLKHRAIELGLDWRGLTDKGRKLLEKFGGQNKTPDELIFIRDSTILRKIAKARIMSHKLLPYRCADCGSDPTWNGKPIVLVLDHINGVPNDHRLDNLQFLCPNCNSQTSTFAGKNYPQVKKPEPKIYCTECGELTKGWTVTGLCSPCSNRTPTTPEKIQWPDAETLKRLVWEKPTSTLARELGVSDSAVGKRCRKYGISKPPRGYWAINP
jgi:Zn finger protein HypA/HybF involved in hydrogenase expression